MVSGTLDVDPTVAWFNARESGPSGPRARGKGLGWLESAQRLLKYFLMIFELI